MAITYVLLFLINNCQFLQSLEQPFHMTSVGGLLLITWQVRWNWNILTWTLCVSGTWFLWQILNPLIQFLPGTLLLLLEKENLVCMFCDWLTASSSGLSDCIYLFLSDLDSRGQRHRHRYFRKSRGSSGVKGAELLIAPPSSYGTPVTSGLPPRFQAAAPRPPPPPSPATVSYDSYVSPHRQASPTARPRYGAARWGLICPFMYLYD